MRKMSELWAVTEEHERDVNLVFEGGGLKGIALVGAYSVLEERGYRPQNIAGLRRVPLSQPS